jgi:hypothetical protein
MLNCERRHIRRPRSGTLQSGELPRLDQIYEDVPLRLLEDCNVLVFADTDCVALDDKLSMTTSGQFVQFGQSVTAILSIRSPLRPFDALDKRRRGLPSRRSMTRVSGATRQAGPLGRWASALRASEHGYMVASPPAGARRCGQLRQVSGRAGGLVPQSEHLENLRRVLAVSRRRGLRQMPRASYRRTALRVNPLRFATAPMSNRLSSMTAG